MLVSVGSAFLLFRALRGTVDETRQEGCRRERHVAAPGTSGTTKGPNHILKIKIII